MTRLRFTLRSLLLTAIVLALSAATAHALPANADLANWRGARNNCYNYGINEKDNDFKQPGNYPLFGVPGEGHVWTLERWCQKMDSLATADGLKKLNWSTGQPIPTPGPDTNLVALGVTVGGKGSGGAGDYHLWRKNGDGSWSHKRGPTKAKTTYTDGNGAEQPLTDPRNAAQTDGYTLCGFYGVAKSLDVPTRLALGPAPNQAWCTVLVHAGIPDRHSTYSGARLSHLIARVPTISPSNQVPDPQWVNPQYDGSMGLGVQPGSLVVGLPPFMQVRDGVVAVHFDSDGQDIRYYNDNNGLESYLLAPFPGVSPWSLTAIGTALSLAGSFFAHRRARRSGAASA